MSRKVRRVPVSLDSKGIRHLADSEIALILRGADDLIGTGGRTLLTRILKGSKDCLNLALINRRFSVHWVI